jgi:predicted glycoside hydrolase/deacetylase ChbG (UPF0249 family)
VTAFILNADDFAMTRGVSDGLVALAEAGRLSATSAIVNTPHWPTVAGEIMALRDRIAVGLHLNLTFGAPLGPMPRLAPDSAFPDHKVVVGRGLSRGLNRVELAGEISRQLDRFQEFAGFPPDFVDGHHHVHVLPDVRDALIEELAKRHPDGGPLLRDPADRPARIFRRRYAASKALGVALLAAGFADRARAANFAVNDGFTGYSGYGPVPFAREFETFLIEPGARPMIMCHPGLPDDELGVADSIAARRLEEHAFIATRPGLPEILWRPARARDATGFPW